MLEAMLHQFPFRVLGLHCDNGSEFLNHQVEKMLTKLPVEFTKSRAYRTTDNALVEGKNGAVVRKHIGYGAIGAEHAAAFQKCYTAYFNPYLNCHRPCGFAEIRTWARESPCPAQQESNPDFRLISGLKNAFLRTPLCEFWETQHPIWLIAVGRDARRGSSWPVW